MKKLRSLFSRQSDNNNGVAPGPAATIDALIDRFAASKYITEMRTIDFINPAFPDIVEFYRATAMTLARSWWDVVLVRVGPDPLTGNRMVSTSAPIAEAIPFFSAVRILAEYQTTCGYIPGTVTADDLGMRHYYHAATLELIAFNRAGLPRPTLDGVLVVADDYPVSIIDPLFPDRISVDQRLMTRNDMFGALMFGALRDRLTGGHAYEVMVQGFLNHPKLIAFHEKAMDLSRIFYSIRYAEQESESTAAVLKDMVAITKDLAQDDRVAAFDAALADRLNGIITMLVFCEKWIRARYEAKHIADGVTRTADLLNTYVESLSAIGAMAGFDDDYINTVKATLFSEGPVLVPAEIEEYLQQIKDIVDQQALQNRWMRQTFARTTFTGPR